MLVSCRTISDGTLFGCVCLCVTNVGWLQEVVGRHIMKVEPLNAILDPQYFVRAVHGCVLAVLQARSEANERRSADNSGFRYSHRGPHLRKTQQYMSPVVIWSRRNCRLIGVEGTAGEHAHRKL